VRRGSAVLGICGGYQMLGQEISDPDGIEGAPATVAGLGLLDVVTVMKPEKRLALTRATYTATGDRVTGYEIHLGETTGADCARAWLDVDGRPEGAASADGRIRGCYLHGLFSSDPFRAAYLAELGVASDLRFDDQVEATLDALAAHLEHHLDLDLLLTLAEDTGV
jgi:adenosylcobyric acid synthase